MTRVKIAKEDDRITVAGILIKNGYTVKAIRQKRGKANSTYEHFLEFEQNRGADAGGQDEG